MRSIKRFARSSIIFAMKIITREKKPSELQIYLVPDDHQLIIGIPHGEHNAGAQTRIPAEADKRPDHVKTGGREVEGGMQSPGN